jgi:hypothetical protein
MNNKTIAMIAVALVIGLYLHSRRDLWQPLLDGAGVEATATSRDSRGLPRFSTGKWASHPEVQAMKTRHAEEMRSLIEYLEQSGQGNETADDYQPTRGRQPQEVEQ